ncbi:hypothetical protein T492DRAFT_974306 [Pavlovales sp. CCMP2436]|nr:hypothetical protein T492DRAFT_974306 [Pavlovales sp. CCMP2436]|mmetsp:Transcript_25763/g.65354  ORF Transcript_25763/g.65354 Transcript_25763/m.65354 type:complete len:348 (-) Transcript_25763:51-1094(-)
MLVFALTALAAVAVDFSPIASGGIVVVRNWLPAPLTAALRLDAMELRADGCFRASGLRDRRTTTGAARQAFGNADRLVLNMARGLGGDRIARAALDEHLELLRQNLGVSLRRPGLRVAEQYYSIHGRGAFLARHLDERHDDTKGELGWTSSTRRSISFLIYLSADGWGEPGGAGAGGDLVAFSRRAGQTECGAHGGNLQVGWLNGRAGHEPVFLDSWVKTQSAVDEGGWRPLSVLYSLEDGQRQVLGAPFFYDAESWPSPADGSGMSPDELEAAFSAQLLEHLRPCFRICDRVDDASLVTRVVPAGGTLVLFDSVAVPHEVAPTLSGERYAMAGWLHQKVQEPPDWC